MRKPLSTPQAAPLTSAARIPSAATPAPSPPMLAMSFAATTDEKTSTEPTKKSIHEVIMTKVIQTPSTAHKAMFWEISEKLLVDRNLLPAAMLKKATMT